MKYLLLSFLFLAGCATQPPDAGLDEVVKTVIPSFAWDNSAWDKALVDEIKAQGLPVASIKDAKVFCPKYASLSESQRIEFWGTFMVAMSMKESSYKPITTYTESFRNSKGELVISTGLFQISEESSSQAAYKCGKQTTASLKDAETNIRCSVKILSKWVKQDGYAAGIEGSNFGCGRYWSVCRTTSPAARKYIVQETGKLKFCK